jgi:hypothetical protein
MSALDFEFLLILVVRLRMDPCRVFSTPPSFPFRVSKSEVEG